MTARLIVTRGYIIINRLDIVAYSWSPDFNLKLDSTRLSTHVTHYGPCDVQDIQVVAQQKQSRGHLFPTTWARGHAAIAG